MGLWEKGMRQGGQGNWVKEGKGEGKEGEKKVRTNLYPPTYENVPTRLFCHHMIHV